MAYEPVTRTVILCATSTSGGVSTMHTWTAGVGGASPVALAGCECRHDDTTAALSGRLLFWTEPGSLDPSSLYRGAGGVPYTLSAEGITEAECFQIANSLNPCSARLRTGVHLSQ